MSLADTTYADETSLIAYPDSEFRDVDAQRGASQYNTTKTMEDVLATHRSSDPSDGEPYNLGKRFNALDIPKGRYDVVRVHGFRSVIPVIQTPMNEIKYSSLQQRDCSRRRLYGALGPEAL